MGACLQPAPFLAAGAQSGAPPAAGGQRVERGHRLRREVRVRGWIEPDLDAAHAVGGAEHEEPDHCGSERSQWNQNAQGGSGEPEDQRKDRRDHDARTDVAACEHEEQQDEPGRDERHHQVQGLVQQASLAMQDRPGEDDERQFRELRGLDLDGSQRQPVAVAADVDAERRQDEHQQDGRQNPDGPPQLGQHVDPEPAEHPGADQTDRQEHELADDVVVGAASFRLCEHGGRGQDHEGAQSDEEPDGGDHEVERGHRCIEQRAQLALHRVRHGVLSVQCSCKYRSTAAAKASPLAA